MVIGIGVALVGSVPERVTGRQVTRTLPLVLIVLWTAAMALPTLLIEDAPRAVLAYLIVVCFTLGLAWIESRGISAVSRPHHTSAIRRWAGAACSCSRSD